MPQCCGCHKEFPRSDFSKAQLKKSPDQRKCKVCVIDSSEHQQEDITSYPAGTSPRDASTSMTTATPQPQDTPQPPTDTKLQLELEKARQVNKDQEEAHQKHVAELENKATEAFQGMERAKAKITHLESLAQEAITGLKTVQEQASAEINALRKKLEELQAERDRLLAERKETK